MVGAPPDVQSRACQITAGPPVLRNVGTDWVASKVSQSPGSRTVSISVVSCLAASGATIVAARVRVTVQSGLITRRQCEVGRWRN